MSDPPAPAPGRRTDDARTAVSKFVPQRSAGLKLILVCALALVMTIPALFVYGIVHERTVGQAEATAAVSEGVGGEQSVLGPVLAVPFVRTPDPLRPGIRSYGVAVAFAEEGEAVADIRVEERRRGIYLVPVFEGEIGFTARFDAAALRGAVPADATALWEEARLLTGLSDTRGIRDAVSLSVNGQSLAMEPVEANPNDSGLLARAPRAAVALAGARLAGLDTAEGPLNVTASLTLSGAERLSIGPFAKDTRTRLTSNWPDPSFTGGVLPLAHTVGQSPDWFEANWRVAYLARGIPGAGPDLDLATITHYGQREMAVRFIREANPYRSVERALKYSVGFIGLVFLAWFLLEIVTAARAHPAQYILVGLAQAVFYLLLLAFAEQSGFDLAYLIAAAMTVLLVTAYAISVFGSWRHGLKAFAILAGIYGLFYALMRAEGFALLAGALASFAAIAVTMFVTRNIDWYGSTKDPA